MKVKELKEIIKDLPDDMLVVVSKDAEGNSITPLAEADADNNRYLQYDNSWDGEVRLKELRDEDIEKGFSFEDCDFDNEGEDALVLWPTN